MMTDATEAFDAHDAYEQADGGYRLTTTTFDGRVELEPHDGRGTTYRVTVRAPTLDGATADKVGSAVEVGWFDTFRIRLEDAAGTVRDPVAVSTSVDREPGGVVVTYGFEWGDPDRAAEIAKALTEYVEGTYVEGIVPGYDYVEPVASLLSNATQGEGQGPPL